MKTSTKIKAGMLLTSLAVIAGATAAAIVLQKKREEEVYHEAELKAIDELEEMMRTQSDCAGCACAQECAADTQDFEEHDGYVSNPSDEDFFENKEEA